MAKIGIKLANGRFYPILDDYGLSAKRLELVTVRDGQPSAQIDFFRSDENAIRMEYIGTVVVDNLAQRPAGETSIDLLLRAEENGLVLAEAEEAGGSGGPQRLTIDLEALDVEEPFYDDVVDVDLYDDDDADDGGVDAGTVAVMKRPSKPGAPMVIAAIVLLILVMALSVVFFSQEEAPPENISAEAQSHEEIVVLPSVENDDAQMPEVLSGVPAVRAGAPDGDRRDPPIPEKDVPDMSRKALRTETVR